MLAVHSCAMRAEPKEPYCLGYLYGTYSLET
jgi:hypothetical protein